MWADTHCVTTPSLDATATTDLSDLVEPLKRELAVPGEFVATFPNTADDDLVGTLQDGFAKAQLDGFFGTQTVDLSTGTVTPGLSSGGQALVLMYSAEGVIRAQIRNLKTRTNYESAGSQYEVERAASVLVESLKDLTDRKQRLLDLMLRLARAGQACYVTDAYLLRAQGYLYAGALASELGFGLYGWELPGFWV